MTRRAAAALLLLLAVLLVLAVIAPPAHSDQSVAATAVPASEFIPIEPAVTPAPSVHSASITPASATPVPSLAPVPRVPAVRRASVARSASVTGISSWYRYVPGGAAAGPRLRSALGPGWRGSVVRVCSGACVVVTLSDFMRADRLIDLDVRSWAAICGDPSGGLCRVEVTP
jgi:hypothetical protein